MIVITVVYASERSFARSSTMSRTVACLRFQRRSMTAVSSGPRKVFAPRLVTIRSSHLSPQIAAPLEQAGMPFAPQLAAVRERQVQADDEVPVARQGDRAHDERSPGEHPEAELLPEGEAADEQGLRRDEDLRERDGGRAQLPIEPGVEDEADARAPDDEIREGDDRPRVPDLRLADLGQREGQEEQRTDPGANADDGDRRLP